MKEKQEPDFFATAAELPVLALEVLGDSAEINVLAAQQLNIPVSVEFSKPAHGRVIAKSGGMKFLYKADPGFFGKDTIAYKICKTAQCRSGKVLVAVNPDPSACLPIYSPLDTQFVSIPSGPGKRSVSLLGGDVYCPENQRVISSGSVGINELSISDSIRFFSAYSRRQKRNLLISYANKDSRTGTKYRYIKLSMVPDEQYCDSYFKVQGLPQVLQLGRNDTLTIKKSSLLPFVQVCEGDLDPSYFEVNSSPNLGLIPVGNGSYRIFFLPFQGFGLGKLEYRFRNLRGITDTGSVRIIRHLN